MSEEQHKGHQLAVFCGGWSGNDSFGLLFELTNGSKIRLQVTDKNAAELEKFLQGDQQDQGNNYNPYQDKPDQVPPNCKGKELLIFEIDRKRSLIALKRVINGNVNEGYLPMSPAKAVIYAASVLQDYQPPKCLKAVEDLDPNHDLLHELFRPDQGKRSG